MGVIAKGIPRGCHGLFTPVSLRYPLSVFNKNSTLKESVSGLPSRSSPIYLVTGYLISHKVDLEYK